MKLSREVQLKLLVEGDLDKLNTHPLLNGDVACAPHLRGLVDVYFDTPAFDLRQQGASLHIRRVDEGWIQTLTLENSVAGMVERYETEERIASPEPDVEALKRAAIGCKPVAEVLKRKSFARRLREAFRIGVERTVWEVRPADGTQIECVLDTGVIEGGGTEGQRVRARIGVEGGAG